MSLERVLRSVVNVLSNCSIPYAVMGGLAVRLYAIPRFTNDVDITIRLRRDGLGGLFKALESIGCEIPSPFREGWLDSVSGLPLFKAEIYDEGRVVEIDLFVSESAFQNSVVERRRSVKTSEGEIDFVSPEDLILLKLISARPRDLIDVQDILFTMGDLDQEYMEDWARQLSIDDALRAAVRQFNSGDDQT